MLCNFAHTTLSQFAIQVDTAALPALEVGWGRSIKCWSHFTGKVQGQFESKSMSDHQQSLHHKPKS